MPGAYEKQMHGDRFDALTASVQRCFSLMETNDFFELVHIEIPLLLLSVAEMSKPVIEEFCYSGGIRLFCKLILSRSSNSAIGDVTNILVFFSTLLGTEFDPYDDDLGILPLLTYFLCERHTHYVDIEWNSEELQLMQYFLESHIELIGAGDTVNESMRLIAIDNLHGALLTFPPHRVVSNAAAVFNLNRCILLREGLFQITTLWVSSQGRRRIAQLLLSIASFGLGPIIPADLLPAQVILTLNSLIFQELRCACSRCEFVRRLQRVARERDEFGVGKANDAKKQICFNLLKAGILECICRVLEQSHLEFGNVKKQCWLTNDKETAIIPTNGESDNELSTGVASSLQSQATSPEQLHSNTCYVKHTTDEMNTLCCRLSTYKDITLDKRKTCNNDDILNDNTQRLICLTVLLFSSAYEEINQSSILTYSNNQLLIELLRCLNLTNFGYTFNADAAEFLPGIRTVIETICTLSLKAPSKEQHDLILRSKPTIEALLQKSYETLITICGYQSRQWRKSMACFAPVQAIMLATIYIGLYTKSSRKKQCRLLPITPSLMQTALCGCQCLLEGYEWSGCEGDERTFITTVLLSMALLTGCFEYLRCNEARRRFFPAPDPRCGFMASSARWLLEQFDKGPAGTEGCVIIRSLGSLVISRAEKASAVVVNL